MAYPLDKNSKHEEKLNNTKLNLKLEHITTESSQNFKETSSDSIKVKQTKSTKAHKCLKSTTSAPETKHLKGKFSNN